MPMRRGVGILAPENVKRIFYHKGHEEHEDEKLRMTPAILFVLFVYFVVS
jgi:hypothetical protein